METQLALLRPWGRGAWAVVEPWRYGEAFDALDRSAGACRRRTWARDCHESPPSSKHAETSLTDGDAKTAALVAPVPRSAAVELGDGSSLAPEALRSLLLSQGGVLELGRVLYACDEALENERWLPGGRGFSPLHLLPTDVGPWSSLDGSLSGPHRDAVAPPRDAEAWTKISDWEAFVDRASTDRRGWAYSRELPDPNNPAGVASQTVEASGMPFPGALARRRRWLVVYSRPLHREKPTNPVESPRGSAAAAAAPRAPPAFLARLQDSFRLGVNELNRRLSAVDAAGGLRFGVTSPERGAGPQSETHLDGGDDGDHASRKFAQRWNSNAAHRCKQSLAAFVRNFGKHETPGTSDEARAARVKRFLAHAARLLRAQPPWATEDEADFEVTVDHLEALLYSGLCVNYRLITECDDDDQVLEHRFSVFRNALTPKMLDAPEAVARCASFGLALEALNGVPDEATPRRATKKIRFAVDRLFECLAELARNARRARNNEDGGGGGGDAADEEDAVPGADDLLPLVIFACLKARPKKLHSALKFIELYSSEDKMRGEAGFLLTQLSAAATFLSTLGPDQLKGVDAEAFEALLQGKRHSLEPDTLLVDVEERDDAAPGDGDDDDATVDAPPPASDSEQTADAAEDLPKDEVKPDRTEASEAAPPPADLVVEDAPPLREGGHSDDDGDETPLQLNRRALPDTM